MTQKIVVTYPRKLTFMKKILLWLLIGWFVAFSGCGRVAHTDVTQAPATRSNSAASRSQPLPSTSSAPVAPSAGVEPLASPVAPAWKRPFLYRITGKGTSSHLFGTIHLPDQRLDTFPPVLRSALDQSDAVYTEIPLDDASQLAIAPRLMLPGEQTLASILPAPLHRRLSAAFAQQAIPFAPFERMKPWAISVQLAVLDRMTTLALKKPIDAVIHQRAIEAGKETRALETVEEQVSIFDRLSRSEQIELLRLTLDYQDTVRRSGRDALEELLGAYLAGDTDAILNLVREAYDPKSALSRKLMKQVFSDRNESMANRIAAELRSRTDQRLFFAVGSGHLLGDDGIVKRLQQQGFVVVPVVAGL